VVKTPFGVKLLTNAHVVENATTVRIRRAGSPFMYSARVNAIANECDLAELVVDDPAFWKETHELEALNLADLDEEAAPITPPAPVAPTTGTQTRKKTKAVLKKEKEAAEEQSKSSSSTNSTKSKPTKSTKKEKVSEVSMESALELGTLPELHSRVTVIGYPTGGDNVSVTRGVVSRIEPQSYTESHGNELLAIQIDAAINPGNSGGPALDDQHRVVGVAFCSLQGAENIGYIIPTPIILHFLEDLQRHNGQYTGFVRLGLVMQSLDQIPAACEYFKLKPNMSGLLVANVDVVADAATKIKKDDVLLSVEGVPLANDGTVPFRHRERIHFEYLLMQKFKGDLCKVTVWRDGKELELEIKLKPKIQELVPSLASNSVRNPPYIVYGGLVFTKLSFAYLVEYGEDWYNTAPRDLLYHAFHAEHLREGQEIVILSHVLVDDCNLYVAPYCLTFDCPSDAQGHTDQLFVGLRHASFP
jgi:S1-C subfamily serine protease